MLRWLKPGGVLVSVVPGDRRAVDDTVLATPFRDKKAYRLTAPDSEKYKQVVLFGIRLTRRERDRRRDVDVIRARGLIFEMSRRWDQLPALPDTPAAAYSIPESGRWNSSIVACVWMRSKIYCHGRLRIFGLPKQFSGRPLTPLHAGHVAICAVSGMLNGVFGSGESRHVAAWNAVKIIDRSEQSRMMGQLFGASARVCQ